jgi:hypothetical protein
MITGTDKYLKVQTEEDSSKPSTSQKASSLTNRISLPAVVMYIKNL